MKLSYKSQILFAGLFSILYSPFVIFQTPQISEQEASVISRIETARTKLRHNLASPRRWTGLLRRNTFARAIRGSNSIEGYHVTAEDAIAAAEGEEPLSADQAAWAAVTGYRTAMTFALQLGKEKDGFKYSEWQLRSLHFMMLQHELQKNPGSWRRGTIYVRDEGTGDVVYEAPDVEMVPCLIDELISFLNTDDGCPHALIKGSMAHLNLVMIHPFSDGNGRMARCLQTLVLAREGILAPEFSSIEEYLGRNTQDYYKVLGQTGEGSWRPKNSTRAWIRFNLTAHFRQAQTLLNRTSLMSELWLELEEIARARGLPERVLYALTDAALGYRVRNSSYRNMADLSDIYASRDLKSAVDAGLLVALGERRGRIYIGAPQLKSIFERLKGQHMRSIPDPFTPESFQLELTNLA